MVRHRANRTPVDSEKGEIAVHNRSQPGAKPAFTPFGQPVQRMPGAPMYRPGAAPVQRQVAAVAGRPGGAPPVYRLQPQPVQRFVQPSVASVMANPPAQRFGAPPVYRPAAPPVQRQANPVVYRPGSPTAAVPFGVMQPAHRSSVVPAVAGSQVLPFHGGAPPVYRVGAPGPVQAKPASCFAAPAASAPARFAPPVAMGNAMAGAVQRDTDDEDDEDRRPRKRQKTDDEKDGNYFEKAPKSSGRKQPSRAPFKPDQYSRFVNSGKIRRAASGTPRVQNRNVVYEFDDGHGNPVYLNGKFQEMRDDKRPSDWKKVDKDHQIDNIALVAEANALINEGKHPGDIDYAFALAVKSTKHLEPMARRDHKTKPTHRLNNIPKSLRKRARNLLLWKLTKCADPKHQDNFKDYRDDHDRGNPPRWSPVNYVH
jgi:hypothetical protein